jgi:type VI protein secretion system component Hcp
VGVFGHRRLPVKTANLNRGRRQFVVTQLAPSLVAGTMLSEHVSLKYSKIKWTYTQQNIAGGARGSTVGGWDLAANKIAA